MKKFEESLQVVLIDLRLLAGWGACRLKVELGLDVVGAALGELRSEGDPCLGSRWAYEAGTIIGALGAYQERDNNYWQMYN